jgi:undecaprenyl pyrophosphate synthase
MRSLFNKLLLVSVLLAVLPFCQPTTAQDRAANREVTILYTNDFHSAFDPIPAYWLPGEPKLGGAAQLAALINQYRQRAETSFLFDSGDMFTGQLSFLTRGEALMEMMISMHYDAMAIGNHEFDYGSANFTKQMSLVPFPVLGANIYYKGTNHRYARPSTIIERNGVRLGVIGRRDRLPHGLAGEIETAEKASALGTRLDLTVAIDYSGRDAIANAAAGWLGDDSPPRAAFSRLLALQGQGTGRDVDLLIRSGGEKRLSDFLLWECAYAELLFTDIMWPDFGPAHLRAALADFHNRERRFGGLGAAPLLAAE